MQSLTKKALSVDRGRPHLQFTVSNEELELFEAMLLGEVTYHQVHVALGRSYGYTSSWIKRCTMYLFQMGVLVFEKKGKVSRYEAPSYITKGKAS